MVTLPDFWTTIHTGDLEIVRDNLGSINGNTLLLQSGTTLQADFIVMATGWGDHFGMFDSEAKMELGLPAHDDFVSTESVNVDIEWEKHEISAEKTINKRLPFLAVPPGLKSGRTSKVQPPRRWRLYRRSIPLSLAVRGDRSLAILGQIHTVQTPLVSEMQSFWSILYLLGELDLPDEATMTKEIAEWNAWTRKRYLNQGRKFPYSLYDFLPVSLSPSLQTFGAPHSCLQWRACSAYMIIHD